MNISVYQFALAEKVKGKDLVKKMLEKTGYKNFDLTCFIDSEFNKYYEKTGWILEKTDEKFNYYRKLKHSVDLFD